MQNQTTILTAGKYSEIGRRKAESGTQRKSGLDRVSPHRSPKLFIPTLTGAARRVKLADWYWKEIKEGGFLYEYLASEKRRMPHVIRNIARVMSGFQQNNKSDFRRLAAVPARLYHRWKGEDEHFFEDDENLRSLKRDNPDLPVYVAPRQLPVGRFRKVYSKAESGKRKAETEGAK